MEFDQSPLDIVRAQLAPSEVVVEILDFGRKGTPTGRKETAQTLPTCRTTVTTTKSRGVKLHALAVPHAFRLCQPHPLYLGQNEEEIFCHDFLVMLVHEQHDGIGRCVPIVFTSRE